MYLTMESSSFHYVTHFGVDKGDAMENVAISLELVESMVKDFKTPHRCALRQEIHQTRG